MGSKSIFSCLSFTFLIVFFINSFVLGVYSAPQTNYKVSAPLWRYQSGSAINGVAISDDGTYLAVGTKEKQVLLFNKSSSTPLWMYTMGGTKHNEIAYIDISSDGEYLAASGPDGLCLFERSNSTPIWKGNGRHVKFSKDGNYIVSSIFPNLLFYNRSSNAPLWAYTTTHSIQDIAISENGSYIAMVGIDYNLTVFHKSSNVPIWSYNKGDIIWGVEMSADGKNIAIMCVDNKIHMFDFNDSVPIQTYQINKVGSQENFVMTDDGQFVFTGDSESEATSKSYLFDRSESSPIWNFTIGDNVKCSAISTDGKYFTACTMGDDNRIYFFNKSSSDTPWWTYRIDTPHVVDISVNGQYVVVGSHGGNGLLYLFDWTEGVLEEGENGSDSARGFNFLPTLLAILSLASIPILLKKKR